MDVLVKVILRNAVDTTGNGGYRTPEEIKSRVERQLGSSADVIFVSDSFEEDDEADGTLA